MATSTNTLFVDESGNAGPNYLDDEQPFHVAAGFLVAQANLTTFRDAIKTTLRAGEKGAQLMKSPDGQRRAIDIIKRIGAARGTPFFVIMDRRFAISGKMVDVFLDPFHQDAVDWLPTSALQERQRITERLSDMLSTTILNDFAKAYKAPAVGEFERSLRDIIACLQSHGDARLVTAFNGALRHVAAIVKSETYGDAATTHGQWASLNVPALAHLLRHVDRVMDSRSGLFDVVHDRQEQFRLLFERLTTALSDVDADVVEVRVPDGTTYRGIYRNLNSFCTCNSASEVALQAADVLASSIARLARVATQSHREWTDELQQLALMTLPALMDDCPIGGAPPFASIYAHERTTAALLTRMFLHQR